MSVAFATARALRDEIAAALARECPWCRRVTVRRGQPDVLLMMAGGRALLAVEVVRYPLDYAGIVRGEWANAAARVPSVWYVDSGGRNVCLIERRFDPETANYGYGDIIDVVQGSDRPWATWLKVAGCERF